MVRVDICQRQRAMAGARCLGAWELFCVGAKSWLSWRIFYLPDISVLRIDQGPGATKLRAFCSWCLDQLGPTIETVITAVRAGELDELMAQQAKARDVPRTKRAA